MRKFFSTFLLALMSMTLTWAQDGGLTTNTPVGTIGMVGGREAMVVDLGGTIGKVAVATRNVGAASVSDYGAEFDIDDVNGPSKNKLSDGWYVPSKEELDALFANLDFNEAGTGLEWKVTASATLQIPGGELAESGEVYGYSGLYLSSTLENDGYCSWAFQIDNRGHKVKQSGSMQINSGVWWCHIRPLYKLIDVASVRAEAVTAIETMLGGTTDEVTIYYCNRYIQQINHASTEADIAALQAKAEHAIANQDEATALQFNFTGEGMPIEDTHDLDGLRITYSEDGEEMTLMVNNAGVTYNLDNVSSMSHFRGIPSVSLHANQDPDANTPSFYTTFYSGLEAYTLPEGVKAYTANVSDNTVVLTLAADEGEILPQGEAVLLYSTEVGDFTMTVAEGSGIDRFDSNMFDGVDVATDQAGSSNYMLSYGQNGLGFYKMSDSMLLSANKAFLPMPMPNMAKGLRMVFDNTDGGVTGVNAINVDVNADVNIYNIGGIRLNKLQKGINIVGGKKIVVK